MGNNVEIKKTSDTTICLSFPNNSWNEVNEINIIFGKTVYLIYNSSYRPGFNDRQEKTHMNRLSKQPNINPCVLCDDVYNKLMDFDFTEKEEELVFKATQAIVCRMNIDE